MKTTLILGPPGTGKTTKLLEILDQKIHEGVDTREIGFVSFTRKAAYEAKDRALAKFDLKPEALPWFRTLHSFAFQCLGLDRSQTMTREHFKQLSNILGIYIPMQFSTWEGESWGEMGGLGSALVRLDQLARVTCRSLRDVWHEQDDFGIPWIKLDHFSRTYESFKVKNMVYDFTDTLGWFIRGESDVYKPKLSVLFVDEAQDLCQLQWRMVKALVDKKTKDLYLAGDDDQAIYIWSGADVDTFLHLEPDETIVLDLSYRLPEQIWRTANLVSLSIQDRYVKAWTPRPDSQGISKQVQSLEAAPLHSGQWLILVRNRAFMEEITKYCYSQGFPYTCLQSSLSPLQDDRLGAILYWEKLRAGESVSGANVRKVYKHLPVNKDGGVRRGFKLLPAVADDQLVNIQYLQEHGGLCTSSPWYQAMLKIPSEDREYLLKVLQDKDPQALGKPRIHVSTIHSVKGGEADNVLLSLDMSVKTYKAYKQSPDAEHRVYYVAVTRAKEALYILRPRSSSHYEPLA